MTDGNAAPTCRLPPKIYLDRLGLGVADLFHHILAVLHDSTYREANAGRAADGVAAHLLCLAGPTAIHPALPRSCSHLRRGAWSWPRC